MATEKEVLVRLGVHSRVVRFTDDSKEELYSNIRATFSEVSQVGAPNTKLLVQIKDERWSGEFIDIKEDKNIPDQSVLNVFAFSQAEQVGFFFGFLISESDFKKLLHFFGDSGPNSCCSCVSSSQTV